MRSPVSPPADAPALYASFDDRKENALAAAATLPAPLLRRFMQAHLPGSCHTFAPSPFLDCKLFTSTRGGAPFHPLAQRTWQSSTSPAAPVSFYRAGTAGAADAAPAFVLDCSSLEQEVSALLQRGIRVGVMHSFHPHLPIAVSCCGALGSLVLHYRAA